MKLIDYQFDPLPDAAQFCTETVIYSFHAEGFLEFKAYCMINSMARPVGLELEVLDENHGILHLLTQCEMTAMSEKCILLSGKLACREVNQQLQLIVRDRLSAIQED